MNRILLILLGAFLAFSIGCDDEQPKNSCGDNFLDPDEECDTLKFGGVTCENLGLSGGNLSCSSNCKIITDGCTGECGNGLLEEGETCDGTVLPVTDCAQLEDYNFTSGTLSCKSDCTWDFDQCNSAECGNNIIDTNEECDGDDLQGVTCETLGFSGGMVSCHPTNCLIDSSDCHYTFRSIYAGYKHTCAIDYRNRVWCWGKNTSGFLLTNTGGFLGDGTEIDRPYPVEAQFPAGVEIVKVSPGIGHTCALDTLGKVWCWGNNAYGQLGTGDNIMSTVPVEIAEVQDDGNAVVFTDVDSGANHSCALAQNKDVWCWGSNGQKQLGILAMENSSNIPVKAAGGADILEAGGYFNCFINEFNETYCWGNNVSGELGIGVVWGDYADPQLNDATALEVISSGGGHSCGKDVDDTWVCWGFNNKGQIGSGSGSNKVSSPEAVQIPMGVTFTIMIPGAQDHTCAIDTIGRIFCWGFNEFGKLGDGTIVDSELPKLVLTTGQTAFTAVAASAFSTCAIDTNGDAWCWGGNDSGQLGDNTTTDSTIPVPVIMPK